MVSIEMKLIPAAVLKAMGKVRLSRPKRSSIVSRVIEDAIPAAIDTAMIVPTPSSGYTVCSVHMAEKSPAVQPARHRKVLSEARLQADCRLQKDKLVVGGIDDFMALAC